MVASKRRLRRERVHRDADHRGTLFGVYLQKTKTTKAGNAMTRKGDFIPAAIKLWTQVKITPTCWEWTGCCDSTGYGCINAKAEGKGIIRTHRLAFELVYGIIPDRLHVLHTCDNQRCVNPEHLFLGTQHDNNVDRDSKGRVRHGSTHPYAKINERAALDILLRYRKGESPKHLAAEYGIHPATIWDLVHGKTWKRAVANA